eukprot:12783979-Heterocapsa_arctica.AAC.1
MFVFRGRGAQDAYIFVRKLYAQQRLQGPIGEDAKHLGAWHHARHSMVKEVQQRICAAQRAWSTFRGCWYDSAVPLRVRRLIYLAVVRTTLTSGLIAACLTETQHKQLEAQQMRCARSLQQGAEQGKTNNMVRRQLKLPTIVSWLSAQRLHWLQ